MEWYQVLTTVLIPIILALVGIIWRQNNVVQRINETHNAVIKNDLDKRIAVVEIDAKEIKNNYIAKFSEVNSNIGEMRDEVTNRLTRIETKLEIHLHQ